jgi:hypothetical protein
MHRSNHRNVGKLAFMAAAVTVVLLAAGWGGSAWAAAPSSAQIAFPPALDSYGDAELTGIGEILVHRIQQQPFNLFATLIFLCAIVHTFMASRLMAMSHAREHTHLEKIRRGEAREGTRDLLAGAYHFLGEVEVVFGLWVIPLIIGILVHHDWSTVLHYIDDGVNLTEAAFVVVIMVLASTRPILQLGELIMMRIAGLFGGTLGAFWVTVMTIGPLLGSFITEPAAMTITALLLSQKFYDLGPSARFRYATLGLLFVNVSVGGTLTHFAAPPVLMVAGPWGWGTDFMLLNFGWKAILGILIANGLFFLAFRKELAAMQDAYALELLKDRIARDFVPRQLMEEEWANSIEEVEQRQQFIETVRAQAHEYARAIRQSVEPVILSKADSAGADSELVKEAIDARFAEVVRYKLRRFMPALLPEAERPEFRDPDWDQRQDPVPAWITLVHLLFMGWTIVNAHHAELFVLGLLFFLGFAQVTAYYQNRINLQSPLLVGFFLAGLVIHGGLQGWWIAPVLGSLSETPLMLGATVLTAFNDNAAITYLSTLVPGFSESLQYAVVAGAVSGGGLTVIANAPNPAGQSLLKKHFDDAVSPLGLLMAALLPTAIVWLCFAML